MLASLPLLAVCVVGASARVLDVLSTISKLTEPRAAKPVTKINLDGPPEDIAEVVKRQYSFPPNSNGDRNENSFVMVTDHGQRWSDWIKTEFTCGANSFNGKLDGKLIGPKFGLTGGISFGIPETPLGGFVAFNPEPVKIQGNLNGCVGPANGQDNRCYRGYYRNQENFIRGAFLVSEFNDQSGYRANLNEHLYEDFDLSWVVVGNDGYPNIEPRSFPEGEHCDTN
jgi:hypothetical protein